MNLKRDEFRSLRQGGRTLKEYMDDFCALARYAPEDIDTDAKRKEKFLNGLKGELKIPLSVAYAPSYQSLLDQAITLDNNIKKEENRKRKFSSKNHTEPFHKKHHSSMGMEVIAHSITVISTRGMATISMVTSSMEDPGEIIPMGITVDTMAHNGGGARPSAGPARQPLLPLVSDPDTATTVACPRSTRSNLRRPRPRRPCPSLHKYPRDPAFLFPHVAPAIAPPAAGDSSPKSTEPPPPPPSARALGRHPPRRRHQTSCRVAPRAVAALATADPPKRRRPVRRAPPSSPTPAGQVQKTITTMLENRAIETKEKDELKKENDALKMENKLLKETIEELAAGKEEEDPQERLMFNSDDAAKKGPNSGSTATDDDSSGTAHAEDDSVHSNHPEQQQQSTPATTTTTATTSTTTPAPSGRLARF
ncbi:hypothetical protein QYE76_023669 [Lolium multiflorum]|uniref:Retrotransposon gag domain-containing protein n=1 Tax=Lolium multiflorum TaxID=4521 RepID=A0AAD8VSH4_LOLMU|nr:hypothetical protein QYE76_023669 [Lolium multiflorum]